MSDNHDLLNDKDVCSFEEHEAENVCSNKDAVACGSRVLSTSGEFVEVLNFREDNEESSEEYCIWYEETHSDRINIFYSIE